MIKTYADCIHELHSDYQIKKAVDSGDLVKIEKGIYADTDSVSALEILTVKYPGAIITMDTAFYYHGLTDIIPGIYFLATDSHARIIKDSRVHQVYEIKKYLELGVFETERRGIRFRMYDRERMLIELLRNKNKLPYDYYKEILGNYRSLIYDLDIERIQDYAATFPKSKMITTALEAEVF